MIAFDFKRFGIVVLTLVLTLKVESVAAQGMNSTRKIRVKPSATSSRIGQGVSWQKDLDTALERSAETGKPVFWYVPTLQGSFMDRKPVIDRYMMAGPFSWESTRKLINENFVPVKAAPDRDEQEKFNLLPYKFVEPGFLVLDSDGNEMFKVDRITTLHEPWFNTLLLKSQGRDFLAAQGRTQTDLEKQMAHASNEFHLGRHDKARKIWKKISAENREHPLGWKAAAEAEGFGPIVRGFEIETNVPTKALSAGINSAGSTAPRGAYSVDEVTKRGVEYLLSMQREDGGWVDCDYDFGGTDSLPNVHVAVTSLSAMALLAHKRSLPALADKIDSAITRAATFVTKEQNIAKSDRDEILWAYAYRVRFLSRLVPSKPEFKIALQQSVTSLESIQTKRGSWYHEYSNPFVTATALAALAEAELAGATLDKKKVLAGAKALANDRFANGAFPYARRRADKSKGTPGQIAASAGRMPLCELGLWSWQQSTDDNLVAAVEISFDMHEHLTSALKYDDHTSNMGYGGFFFWYDMRGRSEAISKIADTKKRLEFQKKQMNIVMSLPEIDGCFVDSHELGRCYGTAMALLCLKMSTQE